MASDAHCFTKSGVSKEGNYAVVKGCKATAWRRGFRLTPCPRFTLLCLFASAVDAANTLNPDIFLVDCMDTWHRREVGWSRLAAAFIILLSAMCY